MPLPLMPLIMGGSALLGGIGNLFGGKDEYNEELINKYMANMENRKAKRKKQAEDEEIKLRRYNEAMKHFAMSKASQKAAELGVNTPNQVYANDMAGDTEMYKSISDIGLSKDRDIEEIDNQIANAELNKPYQEPAISKFLGGAISTASTVGKFMPLFMDPLGGGKPAMGGGGGTGSNNVEGMDLIQKYAPDVNNIRMDATNDIITDNPVINPIPKVTEGTGTGQGFEGDGLSNDLSNALGGKKKMADKGKKLLKFYDPSAYSLMKMGKDGNKELVDYYASLYS
ncbi:MAG: hypothetical protein WC358_11030 [Ignavibacteria bacterium]|jgi:hypothetical protein